MVYLDFNRDQEKDRQICRFLSILAAEASQAYRITLGARISEVVAKFPTKAAAAAAAGVTVEQLNKWIQGSVKVPADGLFGLSAAADVDFRWLVAGDEPQRSDKAQVAMAVVEGMKVIDGLLRRIFAEEGVRIPPHQVLAEMTEHTVALIKRMDDPGDMEELRSLVPWLENRVRKSLRDPGNGKREVS